MARKTTRKKANPNTMWGGRYSLGPAEIMEKINASIGFDRRLYAQDIAGSVAHCDMLVAQGILTAKDGRAIKRGLAQVKAEIESGKFKFSTKLEDIHFNVEARLTDIIGPAGGRLHTGRSRNEQVSLDLRLFLRRRAGAMQTAIRRLIAAFAALAERCGQARMPAYTHLRRAQPVLIAHFLLAHAAALRRDHVRFGTAAAEADALPLGSGAVAGTNYAIDTASLARTLGFSRVVTNSIDASADRDFVSAFLHACALTMVHLSRFAEDMVIFSGEEYGFFELSDDASTGSSMMPQKKNPDPLELVRGKTGRAIGHLAGWLATMKGLPSGYNKDLQEDKEAVFDAEATLAGSLEAIAIVVEGLSVNTDRAERAAAGLLLATDVADYLVGKGLPFRRAHELVGAMTRRLLSEGRDFESLPLAEWRGYSELFEADVIDRVTTRASVEARRTPQSTHPEAVQAALDDVRVWLA